MRIIERPDSKTVILEQYYHYIRDKKEFENVMKGVDKKDVIITRNAVNTDTFMPMTFFLVPNHAIGAHIKHLYYVADMIESDII